MQQNAAKHTSNGFDPAWRDEIDRVRAQAAWLINSQPANIAFVQNTSFGISIAANGIDWQHGDNLVIPAREFPSNYYPWLNLADRGVELHTGRRPRREHLDRCHRSRHRWPHPSGHGERGAVLERPSI